MWSSSTRRPRWNIKCHQKRVALVTVFVCYLLKNVSDRSSGAIYIFVNNLRQRESCFSLVRICRREKKSRTRSINEVMKTRTLNTCEKIIDLYPKWSLFVQKGMALSVQEIALMRPSTGDGLMSRFFTDDKWGAMQESKNSSYISNTFEYLRCVVILRRFRSIYLPIIINVS